MAVTDALPIPRKNVVYHIGFPILDADGDLVSGATGLDSEVSINSGGFADVTAEAVEEATSSGMYELSLTAAEMNGDLIMVIVKTGTAGAKTTPIVMYPEEAGDIRVNVTEWLDTTPNALVSGRVDISAGAIAANVITAASINAAAITSAKFGAGAINATVIATGAIDADALASDAVMEIRSLVNDTADAGGSSTTVVDAARTEADDVWNGSWILFTSGAVANQVRLITDFDAASDTITFAPAATASIGAGITYEILPAGAVDIQSWLGLVTALVSPNALVTGRVDTSVGAMAANVLTATAINAAAITAAKFGAGAIDAAALAADAVDEIWDEAMVEAAAVPGVTASFRAALQWLFALSRNKITQTATVQALRNDADGANIATAAVSDDATTAIRDEWV